MTEVHTPAARQSQTGPVPAARPSAVYDVIVVGGGPAGATAAHDLARAGAKVALLDKAGRIKPCGGAIPPRAMLDFDIPEDRLVAKAQSARMIAPSGREVLMPIEGGYVGMVDRGPFDEWLRTRAADAGAERITGSFEALGRESGPGGEVAIVRYRPGKAGGEDAEDNASATDGSATATETLRARVVIGADGARSRVAAAALPAQGPPKSVFAYHEIVESPARGTPGFEPTRCDVVYQGAVSPDFYGWVFPHGETTSVGVGSAVKGFSLRGATRSLRASSGLAGARTIRVEGAPLPLEPLKRWDNGRDVVLAGDAAGVVAPASGEGIYYAMLGGRLAAEAALRTLQTGDARQLAGARRAFMKEHGQVFWVLGILQHFWYRNDKRRERFVAMCADPDVQHLTWQAYMNKKLVRAKPAAHLRIFMKDLGHLFGIAPTQAPNPSPQP